MVVLDGCPMALMSNEMKNQIEKMNGILEVIAYNTICATVFVSTSRRNYLERCYWPSYLSVRAFHSPHTWQTQS